MKPYKQTTEYTCAASSLLSILHYFDPEVKLTTDMEFNIWQKSANLPTRASSIYALALIAKEYGLSPSIYLEEKEYDYPDYRFKGYTKKEIDQAKFSSKLYAKRARQNNIPITEKTVTIDDVNKELDKKRIIILRVNAGIFRDSASTAKYIAMQKKNDQYFIIDPRVGKKQVTQEQIQQAMKTLQTKKKRDVRMIVFKI